MMEVAPQQLLGEIGKFPIYMTHIVKLTEYLVRLVHCDGSELIKKLKMEYEY
jgi:hypothetical protein